MEGPSSKRIDGQTAFHSRPKRVQSSKPVMSVSSRQGAGLEPELELDEEPLSSSQPLDDPPPLLHALELPELELELPESLLEDDEEPESDDELGGSHPSLA
jgi:hypothetical protein